MFLAMALTIIGVSQPAKPMAIRWYGQSYFQLETPGGKQIVFDPHAIPAFGRSKVSADIICISHEHDDHNQLEVVDNSAAARVFRGLKTTAKNRTAEWNKIDEKVGGIRIRTIGTYHDAENGLARGKNTIFIIETDGLVICHLGDLGHALSEEQIRMIGKIDVLMIPIGGVYTLNGEGAKKLVAALKPRLFILPMHYGVPGYDDLPPADEFLEGQSKVKRLPLTNELNFPIDSQATEPTVVLLNWQGKK